mgnify:CR=1 FL=1|jgi:hypothetical protein
MKKLQAMHVYRVGHGPMPYVKLDNKWYSLDGWDGNVYQRCRERKGGEILSEFVGETVYKLKPIVENGKTVGYEFVK